MPLAKSRALLSELEMLVGSEFMDEGTCDGHKSTRVGTQADVRRRGQLLLYLYVSLGFRAISSDTPV